MINISLSATQIDELLPSLQNNLSVNIDDNGNCYQETLLTRIVRWIFGTDDRRILSIVNIANSTFDKVEEKGVLFYETESEIKAYQKKFKRYSDLYQELDKQIESLKKISPMLRQSHQIMKCKFCALQYRLEEANGGFNAKEKPDETSFNALINLATNWKSNQALAVQKELLEEEIQQLKKAACYPEWLKQLEADEAYQNEFFNWSLRDNNSVDSFIQYPATQKKISSASLSDRIGRMHVNTDKNPLCIEKIKKLGFEKKILTLPFYHGGHREFDENQLERINILNPKKEILFKKGNYSLTLDELWKTSAERLAKPVHINVSPYGIENVHPYYGYWDSDKQDYVSEIDYDKEGWIHDVTPSMLIDRKIVEQKYKDQISKSGIFIRAISSRSYSTLFPLGCHAGTQIMVPFGKNHYKVIDISRYENPFPTTLWGQVKSFGGTAPGTLSILEQNGNDRQYASSPLFPTEEEINKILNLMGMDAKREICFQAAASCNCAGDSEVRLKEVMGEEKVPSFFSMNPLNVRLDFPLFDGYLSLLQYCPDIVQRHGFNLFLNIVGAWNGIYVVEKGERVWKSVSDYYRQNNYVEASFYNPALLHEKIQNSEIDGIRHWGNIDQKI